MNAGQPCISQLWLRTGAALELGYALQVIAHRDWGFICTELSNA
jgi:hypothetical protein